MKTWFECDGEKPECKKQSCYKNKSAVENFGIDNCCHKTSDTEYASEKHLKKADDIHDL